MIDIIGIDDVNKKLLIGEVKWSKTEIGFEVLERLISKAKLFLGYRDYERQFLIISNREFKPYTIREMDKKNIMYFDIKDLIEF